MKTRSGAAALAMVLFLLPSPGMAQTLFMDQTGAGINVLHSGSEVIDDDQFGTGAAWFDFDFDGDLDLYMTERVGANHLFRNNSDGTFTDVAAEYGAEDAEHDGAGVAIADFNNDGWPDIYLANADNDVLLRNDGGAGFTDITATAFTAVLEQRGTTASWGDYDGDGFLDLYVANHKHVLDRALDHHDFLFHNNGDETFTNVSYLLGLNNLDGFGFIGGWTDFDEDDDLDIFVVNDCLHDSLPNKFYRNDGGIDWERWIFTEVSVEVGAGQCENGMGLARGDYNRDGWIDYYFTNNGASVLLKNTGGALVKATIEAGLYDYAVDETGHHWQTWGANFFDVNLDGWVDLFVAAGTLNDPIEENPQPNQLWRNNGDGTFTNYSDISGVNDPNIGRSSVYADYDGDGDPDLFLVNYGGEAHLYQNMNESGYHWLIVDLVGVASNRDGIGAQLRLRTPDFVEQKVEVQGGSSLGGGDDVAAYFGLGENTAIDELEIRWPSGIVQILDNAPVDQRVRIVEEGVRVVVTPSEWPVEIPATGGEFDYDLAVTNHTSETQDLDVWLHIAGPNGISLTLGPVYRTLSPGETVNVRATQKVPITAPAGTYTFEGLSGNFPLGTQSDRFEFTKASREGSERAGAEDEDAWTSTFEAAFASAETRVWTRAAALRPGTTLRANPLAGPEAETPSGFALGENYPNPFNPTTTITYRLGARTDVMLAVYDVLGRRVRTLATGVRTAGTHRVAWDGRNDAGAAVPSGMYFYRLDAGAFSRSRAMMLVK
ncbi:FG-GAP-like repeat-containing protein [Rhodocaloribacter sp.]